MYRSIVKRASRNINIYIPNSKTVQSSLVSRRFASGSSSSSSSSSQQGNSAKGPGFKQIFVVALVGTAIFVQAAESIEQSKPKNSFSETEYNTYVMNGLKRKKLMFADGDLPPIKFMQGKGDEKLLSQESTYVVDPAVVVDYFRLNESSKYEALLNNLFDQNGKDREILPSRLPQGMICMLIGRYIQDHIIGDKIQDKSQIIIKNFPTRLNDAIKFENDVSNVESIIVSKDLLSSKNDVVDYYKTVNKVEEY